MENYEMSEKSGKSQGILKWMISGNPVGLRQQADSRKRYSFPNGWKNKQICCDIKIRNLEVQKADSKI